MSAWRQETIMRASAFNEIEAGDFLMLSRPTNDL